MPLKKGLIVFSQVPPVLLLFIVIRYDIHSIEGNAMKDIETATTGHTYCHACGHKLKVRKPGPPRVMVATGRDEKVHAALLRQPDASIAMLATVCGIVNASGQPLKSAVHRSLLRLLYMGRVERIRGSRYHDAKYRAIV